MIGWTAEHMELTDGDGRTNRSRYRWNRVRWANPNGHLAKAEPPGPPVVGLRRPKVVLVPADGRHQRLLDLDEFADAIEAGQLDTGTAVDGLRRWQRFLDRHLHADRDPQHGWTDFPPRRLRELAALPAPLGPIVTVPDQQGSRFAFNCDIATPMRRRDSAVYAVDLFADVLVRADGVTYRACDLEEFRQARSLGLILPGEAQGARQGLAELTGIIERRELLGFLRQVCLPGPLNPPIASAPVRIPLTQVPLLSEKNRATWAGHKDLRDTP
jgi:predicted RNA-binding protein associated with RNAse of E/G family